MARKVCLCARGGLGHRSSDAWHRVLVTSSGREGKEGREGGTKGGRGGHGGVGEAGGQGKGERGGMKKGEREGGEVLSTFLCVRVAPGALLEGSRGGV